MTNDNVIIRNCIIHHVSGNGVLVDGASNVTVEDSLIVNDSPPSGIAGESEATDINNIWVMEFAWLQGRPRHASRRRHWHLSRQFSRTRPHPHRGIQLPRSFSGRPIRPVLQVSERHAVGFLHLQRPAKSRPEDIVSVIDSQNVTIARGVIDGDNSVSGVGVMFEGNSQGGWSKNVDAIHMGNGAFSSYSDNVSFNYTRSFDNIDADQGRGDSLSNALIWNVSGEGVSITNSTYTHAGNPDNIVWEDEDRISRP